MRQAHWQTRAPDHSARRGHVASAYFGSRLGFGREAILTETIDYLRIQATSKASNPVPTRADAWQRAAMRFCAKGVGDAARGPGARMPLLPFKKNGAGSAAVLLARQFCAMRANRRDELGGRDFITHFPVDAGLAFIDFDQKNSFAVLCRLQAQRADFARARVVEFGEQGH